MRKHGKFREKGTNFVSGNLEEHNRCSRRDTGALFGTTEDRRRERKGQRRMGSAREDECVIQAGKKKIARVIIVE